MKGKIHSFQSLGTLDGPGVRFVIFMHGCNLHCGYCHNIDVLRGGFSQYDARDIMDKILRYKEYFGSNGGVTVSGGEPLLQAEFVKELFVLCRENGIHTAIDTSGSIWNDNIEKLLDVCDLVLLDIKMADDESYRKYIGCSINEPINFLERLEEKGIDCWIRHVVVGGLNDSEEDARALKGLVSKYKCVNKIEILPFKKLCISKYENMGIEFPFAKFDEPKPEVIARIKSITEI